MERWRIFLELFTLAKKSLQMAKLLFYIGSQGLDVRTFPCDRWGQPTTGGGCF